MSPSTGPPLRAGLIGPGWVAKDRHLPVLQRHPEVEIVALCDRRIDRAREVAAEFGVPGAVDSVPELLDLGLDFVCITTPPPEHPGPAIAALEAGTHVFLEKPMAIRSSDAERMVEAARSAERLLCVSHNFTRSRSARRADRLLAGRPVHYASAIQLSSDRRRLPTWYRDLPGGLMLDESPHLLYTMNHYLGGELDLDDVRAEVDPSTGHPVSVELRVRGRTGRGQITMLFRSPVSEWHVGLVSADRVVDIDLFRDICISLPSDGAHRAPDILASSARALGGHALGFLAAGARYATGRQFWGHDVLIGEFIDAVRGRGPLPVPYDEALTVVRLTDRVLEELSGPS